jgi:hypothetical protein
MIKKRLTKSQRRKYNVRMNGINLTLKSGSVGKVLIEMDVRHLERFAEVLGLFSDDFLKSMQESEQQYRVGKAFKIKSLRDLEKKAND